MRALIALDLSQDSPRLVDDAIALLGKALDAVWLLHVAQPDPDFVGYGIDPKVMRDQVAGVFHREHRALQDMAEALRTRGIAATALLIQGETAKAIIQQAENLDVDLIVVGARKAGLLSRFLPGGLDQGGLRAAGRPVLLMPL